MEQAAFIKKYATTRQHTDSLKWDALQARYGNPDLLAMWVADMEFKVQNKLRKHYKNEWRMAFMVIPLRLIVIIKPLSIGNRHAMV